MRSNDGHPAGGAWRALLLLVVVALVVGFGCAMLGAGDPPAVRFAALLGVWIFGGWAPAAYLLGAIGWGLGFRHWIVGRDAGANSASVAAGVGIAASLTVTHGLGVLGLLHPWSSWVWTGLGLVLLVIAFDRSRKSGVWSGVSVLGDRWCVRLLAVGSAGLGIMLSASAMVPGAQWDSEYGGYDSLSYHLQLPAEWLDAGRIGPSEHNVYSYLPGYMESATVHMASLSLTEERDPTGVSGLASGGADGAVAPGLLALGMAIVAAWMVGRFAVALLARCGVGGIPAARGGCAGAALVMLTPWVQVVGSMAYNETGVMALGGAALLASVMGGLSPTRRGVLVAVLMGGAAGCKPTAVLFLAPACAVLMAWCAPKRAWAPMFALGAVVGVLMLAPWLARNAAHGGNPVFPQAIGLFGSAHWTQEQGATYRGGHSYDGSVADRALMLVRPDPDASPTAPAVSRWRGLTNPQWALTPWLGLLSCAGLLTRKATHKAGAVLLAGIGLGLGAWVAATHLQSRFLVPLVPLLAAGFGVGIGVLANSTGGRDSAGARLGVHAGAVALVASLVWGIINYSDQRGGRPNELLGVGAGAYSGAVDLGAVTDAVPSAWINRNAPDGKLLLVGDSAPFFYRGPIGYATVWDRTPLGDAIRAAPDDPDAWTRSLVDAGYGWVYISFAELSRLIQSGWNDPMISAQRIDVWTQRLGPPVSAWPGSGSALFRLAPESTD